MDACDRARVDVVRWCRRLEAERLVHATTVILTGLAKAVGEVRTAPYVPPATAAALADSTADALVQRGACFLRHHGLLAIGADLAAAFAAASVTERAANVYLNARAHGVDVPRLPADEVVRLAAGWREQWHVGSLVRRP